jgi:polar amino acid transport system permease protein
MKGFWHDAAEFFPILMSGVALTIIVTIGSLLLSTVLGLIWAMMRVSGIKVLSMLSASLINVIRGIPIIVLLFYLLLRDAGSRRHAVGLAGRDPRARHRLFGLPGRKTSAPASRRSTRARSRPAQSIGMGWWLTMRRVVLPQAVRSCCRPTATS